MANSGWTPTTRRLAALPRSERSDALEALVVTEFKAALLMTDDDELPLDTSFFDLGMTSLRLTEIKQELEKLLDRPVDANSLFNSPTLDALLTYLMRDVLPELFAPPASEPVAAPASTAERDIVDSLLHDL